MKRLYSIIGLLLYTLPTAVQAIDPCATIGGCQANAQTFIFPTAINNVAALFVAVAAGASVVFVVYGGFLMLLSFGDESRVTKGRNSVIFALGGFALALASQAIISFIVNTSAANSLHTASGNPALALMKVAVDVMLGVFNTVFLLVAVTAGIRLVVGSGKSDQFGKAKTQLIFAVAGAIVINVARALVNIVLTAGL